MAYGRTATARAVTGVAPMAWQSLRAWLAATAPNTYGSPMNDRKKSTVWTKTVSLPSPLPPLAARPGGHTSAQSSGAPRPATTSARGYIGPSRPSARDSVDAPTLAPHPPHRMVVLLRRASAAAPLALATLAPVAPAAGSAAASSSPMSGRPPVYVHIHLRSIQSLRSHRKGACRERHCVFFGGAG